MGCCVRLASADIVYDNGLNPGLADFFSISFTGVSGQFQVADDSILGGGRSWQVDGARWTGGQPRWR